MSATLTTKYQVRISVPGYSYPPMSWNCRRDGRPTDANLREYVLNFEASTQPDGVNAHLGVTVVRLHSLLVNDCQGTVVSRYYAPMFAR